MRGESPLTSPGSSAPDESALAYMEALRQLYQGRVTSARNLASAATSAISAGSTAGTLSDLLAAAVVELITELPDFNEDAVTWAERMSVAALGAQRPAWAAAIRAVTACGLISLGQRERALRSLAAAEVELVEEESWHHNTDPLGKPQGVAAAHNNLGCAFQLLRFYDEAAYHFQRAAAISTASYGPVLAQQITSDLYNRCMLQLAWALDEEWLGNHQRSVEVAQQGLECLDDLRERAAPRVNGEREWEAAIDVLGIGLETVLSPTAITETHLHRLEVYAADLGNRGTHSTQGTYLTAPIVVLLARIARMLNHPQVAVGAAETAEWLLGSSDPFAVDAAWREATEVMPVSRRASHVHWSQQRETERAIFNRMLSAADCFPFPPAETSAAGSNDTSGGNPRGAGRPHTPA